MLLKPLGKKKKKVVVEEEEGEEEEEEEEEEEDRCGVPVRLAAGKSTGQGSGNRG